MKPELDGETSSTSLRSSDAELGLTKLNDGCMLMPGSIGVGSVVDEPLDSKVPSMLDVRLTRPNGAAGCRRSVLE